MASNTNSLQKKEQKDLLFLQNPEDYDDLQQCLQEDQYQELQEDDLQLTLGPSLTKITTAAASPLVPPPPPPPSPEVGQLVQPQPQPQPIIPLLPRFHNPLFQFPPLPVFPTPPPTVNTFCGVTSRPRPRRAPARTVPEGKSETVPERYPWSTNRRAQVKPLETLTRNNIDVISGDVRCKKCGKQYALAYNLSEKFCEISKYIAKNKAAMRHRAPDNWKTKKWMDCENCKGKKCVEPLIGKKREINWLFLLLGQNLAWCKLEDLKYFCKHTTNHRTGAKDRLIFLTYLGICKQLDPAGPFDV